MYVSIMDKLLFKSSKIAVAFMLTTAMSVISLTITAPQSPASASSCRPLSNSGHCYYAGQYCRHADYGVRGIAGNGARIVCTTNNGIRWKAY